VSEKLVARLGAASGIAYVVLTMIGSSIGGGGSPDLTASRAKIAAWVAKQGAGSAIHMSGGFLELLGLLAFIVFAATLFTVFRRVEGGTGLLSTVVLGAGLVSVTVKLASAGPAFAVYWRGHQGLNPQLSAALIDQNNLSFLLTWSIDAVLLGAASLVILRTRVLPRWLGWLAAVLSPALVLSTFAANHVPPFAMLLTLVWFIATSAVLTFRRRDVTVAEPALAF
jgi:uncharacterized protein DUF4386